MDARKFSIVVIFSCESKIEKKKNVDKAKRNPVESQNRKAETDTKRDTWNV